MKYSKITLGSTYRTKDGRWHSSITIGYDGRGRQIRRTVSAKTKPLCIERRNALHAELLRGERTLDKITVETWATQWLETAAPERLNPRVLNNARSHVRKYIVPTLGAYRLADLGAEEVRELDAAVRRAGVSDRTVQVIRSTLSTCLSVAVTEGLIDSNPCDRVARPRAVSRQRSALTVMEARRVILSAIDNEDPLTSLWAAALMSGGRQGELLGLEAQRLDVPARMVDFSWQLQMVPWAHGEKCHCAPGVTAVNCPSRRHDMAPGYEARECHLSRMFVRPKTSRSLRVVPMCEPLAVILESMAPPRRPGGLVWATRDGRPLGAREVRKAWQAALERAGARQVDFHSTRHTTASLLLEAGVSPEVIGQILGHSELVSTRGYLHINQRMAAEAMGALGELLALPAAS